MALVLPTPPTPSEPPLCLNEAFSLFWPDALPPSLDDQRVIIVAGFLRALLGAGGAEGLFPGVDLVAARSLYLQWPAFRAAVTSASEGFLDLDDALRSFPEDILRCAGAAVALLRARVLPPGAALTRVDARFVAVAPLDAFAAIGHLSVNRLVSIRGNVLRVSSVRPLVTALAFGCTACGAEQRIALVLGKFAEPSRCTPPCRGTKFAICHEAARTEDWQQLVLQELDGDAAVAAAAARAAGAEGGSGAGGAKAEASALRSVRVELRGDLVDLAMPGDLVHVVGIVQAIELEAAQGRGTVRNKLVYTEFIDANSIVATRAEEREPAALKAAAAALCGGGTAATGAGGGGAGRGGVSRFFTPNDMDGIEAIRTCNRRNSDITPLALVVASAVPLIYGNECVKLGLLLALFGGTPSEEEGGDGGVEGGDGSGTAAVDAAARRSRSRAVPVRCNIHVLVVGDPGMGKSQMLRAVSSLAPRRVFVTGHDSTAAGLTASVAADRGDKSGSSSLNAGALVLADNGVCAIDELDKMTSDHATLLEAMEQQRVTVAKAGAISWLPARTSIMAAANPAAGRFNKAKTVSENLRMKPALLSRFDLTFILMDALDGERDLLMSRHVVRDDGGGGGGGKRPRTEAGAGARAGDDEDGEGEGDSFAHLLIAEQLGVPVERLQQQQRQTQQAGAQQLAWAKAPSQQGAGAGAGAGAPARVRVPTLAAGELLPLSSRLRAAVAAVPKHDLIPEPLLRKYVAFARRFCKPMLSPEAALVLRDFYEQLRRDHGSSEEGMPITTRQLESLVRLAEARAKIELRDVVTQADAADVTQLMRDALFEAAEDGMGGLDWARAGGAGMSESKRVKAFVAVLQKEAKKGRGEWPRGDLLELAQQLCTGSSSTPRDLLERVHAAGFLLFQGGNYKLLT